MANPTVTRRWQGGSINNDSDSEGTKAMQQ
jgi:hypothetical protein